MNTEDFSISRTMLPNAKYINEIYPLVEKDFVEYQKNAKEAAFSSTKPNDDVIKRLRFALKNLDAKEIDKIAKNYLLEHQLLTKRF